MLNIALLWFALGAGFLILLKRTEKRQQLRQDYSGIISEIRKGVRREPKHDRPSLIDANNPPLEVLFADFDWFGAALNKFVGSEGGWAIEEMSDTVFRYSEGTEQGRKYKVYYHSIEMGVLGITLGGLFAGWDTAEDFRKNRMAQADLESEYMRFVPYEDAHELIFNLELLLGPFGPLEEGVSSARDWARFFSSYSQIAFDIEPYTAAAHARAHNAATAALTSYLWEAFRHSEDFVPNFEYRTGGPYELLRNVVEHWKKKGIDPYEPAKDDKDAKDAKGTR